MQGSQLEESKMRQHLMWGLGVGDWSNHCLMPMVVEGRAMDIGVAFGKEMVGMIGAEAEAEAAAAAAAAAAAGPTEPHNYYMSTVLEIQNYFG